MARTWTTYLKRTPKEQLAADNAAETARLMQDAQDANASSTRQWAVCSMVSLGTLRVHGWFKTRTDARRCAPHYFLHHPIIARWYDNANCHWGDHETF